jgi:hypothetical protein
LLPNKRDPAVVRRGNIASTETLLLLEKSILPALTSTGNTVLTAILLKERSAIRLVTDLVSGKDTLERSGFKAHTHDPMLLASVELVAEKTTDPFTLGRPTMA